MRSDFSGVQEYDVEMVHFVLNEEISSVANSDINDIKKVRFKKGFFQFVFKSLPKLTLIIQF
jgi:hypothetical protein